MGGGDQVEEYHSSRYIFDAHTTFIWISILLVRLYNPGSFFLVRFCICYGGGRMVELVKYNLW